LVACWLSNSETFFLGSEKGISLKITPGNIEGLEVKIREVL
jgi:hypothetical protein